MPSDEIIEVGKETAKGDCKVIRRDKSKPSILFENKIYSVSVDTREVSKFERDVQLQKMHGIFISQISPITFKENFQIDIINNLIHVYIPNCQYDAEKLKTAIDIVDNLSSKLNIINSANEVDDDHMYPTTKTDIEELANEYRNFAIQKVSILEMVKANSKQLLDKLEEIQLPRIKNILIKFGLIDNENLKCPHCNIYEGKNKASLSAHLRNCKANSSKKKDDNDSSSEIAIETLEMENIVLETEISAPVTKKVGKSKK
jgi:hypothetical protein